MILPAVSIADLLQVAVVSVVAGVGVTAVFALAIVGAVHSNDARRKRRAASSAAWGAMSLLAISVVGASALAGIYILSS